MNKLLIIMAAGTAAIAATPAAAQYGNAWGNQANVDARAGGNIQMRIAQLETRLRAGVRSGEISRGEAQMLRSDLRALTRLERQYSRNGLTQYERQDLQQRLRALRQQFRMADGGGNGNGRWADSDRWDDDDDDRWADNDRNGRNDDDGYYGRGGAYEEVQSCDRGRSSGGGLIGGVLGEILGSSRNGNDNCVRVGQRAPSGLSAVPYELRNQFRDGNGIVYRSDGRHVYQIDVRTNTVLRVYGTQYR